MVDRYEDIADEFILSVMQTLMDLVSAACKAVWGFLKQVIGHPALFVAVGGLSWLWWAHGRDAVIVSVVLAVVALFVLSRVAPARVSKARDPAVGLVGARNVRVSAEVAVGGAAARPCCQVSLRAARSNV